MTDTDAKAQEQWIAFMKQCAAVEPDDKVSPESPKAARVNVVVGSEEEKLLTEAVVATVTRQYPELVKNDLDVAWLALVFLRFRGYAVVDAVARLGRFLEFRAKYGVQNHKTLTPAQKEILLDGARVLLPGTDKERRSIVLVTLRNSKSYDPKLMLQTMHWLLVAILRQGGPEAQKQGMTALIDMEGASFRNIDPAFVKEMKSAMAKCFPLRVASCFIINPSALADIVIPVFKAFNGKIGGRIQVVRDLVGIYQHVDKSQLPAQIGGSLKFDFRKWVDENNL